MMPNIGSRNALRVQALVGLALTVSMVILAVQQFNGAHDHLYAIRLATMFATAGWVAVWTVRQCASLLRRGR